MCQAHRCTGGADLDGISACQCAAWSPLDLVYVPTWQTPRVTPLAMASRCGYSWRVSVTGLALWRPTTRRVVVDHFLDHYAMFAA